MTTISKQNENGLDQFYTNKNIALKCYNKLKKIVNLNDFDIHNVKYKFLDRENGFETLDEKSKS